MIYRNKICFCLLIAVLALSAISAQGQPVALENSPSRFFDSIDHRIDILQRQVESLKQKRDVAYLNLQRELDHALFTKSFEEFVTDEDLEKAKSLVEEKIKKSEFRRDQSSVQFYRGYEDQVYELIKQQKMHYQQLFLKEKNFKKEFERYMEPATLASYQKAERVVQLAIKYAEENKLAETILLLKNYEAYTQALIFDAKSDYDLAELTNHAKSFESVFLPLVTSDSIEGVKEAENLLDYCINYGRLSGSSLNGEYFRKQKMMVSSALSSILERQGREKELAKYTDQSVVAQFDALNPCGVFKWHDQIIVIDEFMPTSGMENVKKGEAILHADRMLATYLQKNKLCQSPEDLKLGYAFIIPYISNAKNTSFFYNKSTQKWQFIACYQIIESPEYTAQVSRYMPPLYFEDEMKAASGNL